MTTPFSAEDEARKLIQDAVDAANISIKLRTISSHSKVYQLFQLDIKERVAKALSLAFQRGREAQVRDTDTEWCAALIGEDSYVMERIIKRYRQETKGRAEIIRHRTRIVEEK